MNKIYIINKTQANLVFRNGYINIARGSYAAVSAEDANSSEFIMAHERGWIEISSTAPDTVALQPVETMQVQSSVQGMAEAELLSDLAKEKEPVATATTEALGAGDAAGIEPKPAVVTAFGQEPAGPAEDEPVRKITRKAKVA